MKRLLSVFCIPVFICLLTLLPVKAEAKAEPMTQEQIEACLDENGLEYYAYMILADAPEELRPVILEARNRIIHNSSWVDDELRGWVCDREGNVIEIVPRFHEIFPEDWEIPEVE